MNRYRRHIGRKLADNRGFTLVELLIAAAIGLILLGGIYQIYVSSITSYRTDEELARLQENGRFAFDFMVPTLRNAGYRGCLAPNSHILLNAASQANFSLKFDTPVEGFEASSATQWDDNDPLTPAYTKTSLNTSFAIAEALGGSDILVVRGPDPNFLSISDPMPQTASTLKVPNNSPGIDDDDILMIINCPDSAIFAVNNWTASSGTITHNTGTSVPGNDQNFVDVGMTFGLGSELLKQVTTVYYVRDKDTSAAFDPGFYRKVGTAAAEELIEGVENMQVLYGVDSDGDNSVDNYLAASAVTNWDEVIAVRVGLLVRSVNEIGKLPFDTKTYTLNGTNIDPLANGTPAAPVDDKRLRQVFVTTVGLRNRVL